MDELADRSLSEWLEIAGDTLRERGFAYGDPRCHLLRVYNICRTLGIQLRDPSELALVLLPRHALFKLSNVFLSR